MKSRWLLLAALALALPVAATEMYSWTDANGVKHFSDSPPPASVRNFQKLNVRGGVTSSQATEDPATPAAAPAGGPAMAAAAGYSPDEIVRNCNIARQNLATLEASPPPAGDAAATGEHTAKIDKARQQIKLFCADASKAP